MLLLGVLLKLLKMRKGGCVAHLAFKLPQFDHLVVKLFILKMSAFVKEP